MLDLVHSLDLALTVPMLLMPTYAAIAVTTDARLAPLDGTHSVYACIDTIDCTDAVDAVYAAAVIVVTCDPNN